MSILEELYNGNICPADKYMKRGSEYYEISRFLANKEDVFLENLTQEQKALYEEILDKRTDQENIYTKEIFVEGFRLGAQIMLEILTEQDRQLI